MDFFTPPVSSHGDNDGVTSIIETLQARLDQLEGVVPGDSAFGEGPAWWAGGKEVAHVDADGTVDIRLTRAEIRARRAELRADGRVHLRTSSSADWLEVVVAGDEDVALAVELVRIAASAHATAGGAVPPPTGADLARRRRFH